MAKAYFQDVDEVAQEQRTDIHDGLTQAEASARLAQHGPNELAKAAKIPVWKRIMAQMADPMVILLLVAAAVSAVISVADGSGDFADVAIILFVVILNAVLGVVQESKSEQALEALQQMASPTAMAVRDGREQAVPTRELVPGDVVLLDAGSAVPADCRITEAVSLKVEESALTGESNAVTKQASAIPTSADGKDPALGDRVNMCYSGSTVAYGRGRAIVLDTGMDTEMGKIAHAITQVHDEKTPLQQKLAELSRTLTKLVIVICLVIFGMNMVRYGGAFFENPHLAVDTLMVAVSLAVAAIPEGLVAVVSVVLSMGVTRMSRRNAIVRKMTAVETLGCTQLICSDKTGTLTQNRMTVVQRVAQNEEEHLRAMALCNDAEWDPASETAVGEPTEAALVADAAQAGLSTQELAAHFRRVGEAPFDSGRKMMSVVVEGPDGIMQYTKGAPDVVLRRCTRILTPQGEVPLSDAEREQLLAQNMQMAGEALRVLASARRSWSEVPADCSPENLEQDLCFLGLSGMIDPVRPEVLDAVEQAHQAGLRVVMITGDFLPTAVAIAKKLDVIDDASQAIMGSDLDDMSDEEFAKRLPDLGVYARVRPEHKVRIVEAWKKRGYVVAMTGDGVNDAPSIKRANIGVGMGITGTDVTKNVADMVLADDNFATIVSAVREGRRIYDNIRKALQFLLSSNLAEVVAVFFATAMGFMLMKPAHLLWVNLITDSLPALALGMEKAEDNVMSRPPRDPKATIFADGLGLDTVVQGLMVAAITLLSYWIGCDFSFAQGQNAQGMTMAFLTLSIVEIVHSFNMRSLRGSVFKVHGHNKWLWLSAVAALAITFAVIEVPPLAALFSLVPLDPFHYLVALGLALFIFVLVEIYKAIVRAL